MFDVAVDLLAWFSVCSCVFLGCVVVAFLAVSLAWKVANGLYRLGIIPRACVGYWIHRAEFNHWRSIVERSGRKIIPPKGGSGTAKPKGAGRA